MATYLQLVKDLARATEVVDPGTISSVAGATGRVAQMAYLVQDAWTQIQNLHGDTWDFLTAEIPETARLTVGIREYTPQSLGLLPTDDEPDIPQWARWDGPSPLSTWPVAADGTETREEETDLTVSSWLEFREAYMRGANAVSDPGLQAQPSVVTVDPLDRLVVYPEPDQSYRLAGYYTRAPQILEADGDVPIVSAEHHPTIVQAAKLLLDHSDEAGQLVNIGNIDLPLQLRDRMAALRRRYGVSIITTGSGGGLGPSGPGPTRVTILNKNSLESNFGF